MSDLRRIRVLLVDDDPIVCAGLELMLSSADDVQVVGRADDGDQALEAIRTHRPDVVLMDVRMPRVDGIAATEQIVRERLAQVLVLTTFGLDEYVSGAIAAGAAGYVLKTIDADALADAVRRVAAGEGVLAPEVTRQVLAAVAEQERRPAPAQVDLGGLTERERETLAGLGRGLSNVDLARELGVSEATVKTHVSRILTKLGCSSRVQAALIARDAGLA